MDKFYWAGGFPTALKERRYYSKAADAKRAITLMKRHDMRGLHNAREIDERWLTRKWGGVPTAVLGENIWGDKTLIVYTLVDDQ